MEKEHTTIVQTARSSLVNSDMDQLLVHAASTGSVMVLSGRPAIAELGPRFVEGASGRSLVVGECSLGVGVGL